MALTALAFGAVKSGRLGVAIFEVELDVGTADTPHRSRLLHEQLKAAILGGQLKPGSRLPSSRKSAALFGMARTTIVAVYDQLLGEGYLTARHGSGTYVADRLPEARTARSPDVGGADPRLNPFWLRPEVTSAFGFFDDGTATAADVATYPERFDFRPGLVDLVNFPFAIWRRVSAQKVRAFERAPFNYGHPQGDPDLRSAVSMHLSVVRAIACHADDLIVTSGAQQAFDMLARALVDPGRTVVAVEDPGYTPTRIPFAAAGARLCPVEVDREGMVIEALPADVDIICVSPSHQFPLGSTLSKERRAALIAFARAHGAIIIEDDYDGEFRAKGGPIKALKTADEDDVVFYVGTFSKSTLPNIRLGFVLPPAWAKSALVTVKICIDGPCSLPAQAAMTGFIAGGHLTRHIGRMRRVYDERRHALLDLLRDDFAEWLDPIDSSYGQHVTALSNGTIDVDAVAATLLRRNVQIRSLRRYYMGPAGKAGLVFGLGSLDGPAIRRAMALVRRTMREAADQ
ncbi:MocR-like pyridoxine biosynthesis transcription factor PdxR [Sphingomonas sp. ERG5]|uniref:MocR-like pyridoxine biosynthesis transcription factor PdxR n=1 Tax=Sphingomonas sp. ERG5 TaxID=1381597 RepID=UPI00068AF4F1|nr:PLP-dependent aminotransferase family protein [Sphingomonas sp. ERG5]